MVVVPPWALTTAVMMIGNMITAFCTTPEKNEVETGKTPSQLERSTLGGIGLLITATGASLLWTSPDPEPLGAWVGIVVASAGGATAALSTKGAPRTLGCATIATAVIAAATLIVRASVKGFS